ncbi:MAG: hypothetical protein H6742_21400 [Alphaproteobacteria bacterium]|nr:hypothetical protein [Alphaproteobacteria bacterium]
MAALFLVLALLSCRPPAPPPTVAWTRPGYFSPDQLHADPDIAALRHEWYAATLAEAGEPSFRALAHRPGRAWRFLWLRQWHQPVIVRISEVGDRGVAEVHLLTGMAEPGRVGSDLDHWRVSLTPEELARLHADLDRVDLLHQPSRDPDDDPTLDGARWVFEGLDDGLAVVVDRFSPEDPDLTQLGRTFLELGRVPFEDFY